MNRIAHCVKEKEEPAVWFPVVRTGAGVDVFTERLCGGLNAAGLRAEITWLPHRGEYLPWTVRAPRSPAWASVAHINTWLHPRFVPKHLPIVATLHHSIHDPALRPYKGWLRASYHRWWIEPVERRALSRANYGVAVSRYAADIARQVLCDFPLNVIYNGIDNKVFYPHARPFRAGKPFRLLYVGSWMARKGVDMLAPIMRDLGGDFVLDYTGGPTSKKGGASMPANMFNIGRLHGDVSVAEAMRRADALLLPSRSEGFGLVAAEAVACGLPVIATKGSSLVEVVEDGVTGILCAQDSVSEFVLAVRTVAANRDNWKGRAERMAIPPRRDFDIDAMVQSYIAVYRSVLRSARQVACDAVC